VNWTLTQTLLDKSFILRLMVCFSYGFENVITTADLYMAFPDVWPFSSRLKEFYENTADPLEFKMGDLKFDAILVFNDPRDWGLDAQIIVDLLLSRQGIFGTLSEKNNDPTAPNQGFQQDGQPELYFSNPDLWWAAKWHLPRLGQGGFASAMEGIWAAVTGGKGNDIELRKTVIGKPHHLTYAFAENQLNQNRLSTTDLAKPDELKRVYMIGDNPESDIRGANNYISPRDTEWYSILVETGVYQPGKEPRWKPKKIAKNVHEAVKWACQQSGWTTN
jgi:HAD superfamily hydrolase (TIGR01456 family)